MRIEPSRVRERGTKVTVPNNSEERIAAFREILERGQYAKIDGTMIDITSASAVCSVYDALSETHQQNYASRPAGQMAVMAFKLLSK